jgi:SAM-dependent methyltransferase
MKERSKMLLKRVIPDAVFRQVAWYTRRPRVGRVNFGDLHRVKPISADWGFDRGQPIDRYYIERFLAAHERDIRGHVLEIGQNTYTRIFGRERVAKSEVLHVAEKRPHVTLLGDLTTAHDVPSASFDCAIVTQTLQVIYDVRAALRTVSRILKPGGVALVTLPGISKVSRYDMDRWGYYWSFTTRSAQQLFEEVFPPARLSIQAHGNVLIAIAFLHGLAADELTQEELHHVDPDFQVLITVRASTPESIS